VAYLSNRLLLANYIIIHVGVRENDLTARGYLLLPERSLACLRTSDESFRTKSCAQNNSPLYALILLLTSCCHSSEPMIAFKQPAGPRASTRLRRPGAGPRRDGPLRSGRAAGAGQVRGPRRAAPLARKRSKKQDLTALHPLYTSVRNHQCSLVRGAPRRSGLLPIHWAAEASQSPAVVRRAPQAGGSRGFLTPLDVLARPFLVHHDTNFL
jgi:hypothetical protein